jgi:hypothetical protein
MEFIFGLVPLTLLLLIYFKKTAIRIITNSKYNAHTESLFKHLDILPLPSLIQYRIVPRRLFYATQQRIAIT